MIEGRTQTAKYWRDSFQIEDADLDLLYNLLIEEETPLTPEEMVRALVERRVKVEAERLQRQRTRGARIYRPRETYEIGEQLVFPALDYALGTVQAVRPGSNPEDGQFVVLQVDFGEDRSREFAANLASHRLNATPEPGTDGALGKLTPEEVIRRYGRDIQEKLTDRLAAADDLLRIAGRWFPRALLVDINIGHLNLAEAALDMAGGGPLPTAEILPHLELPQNVNSRLLAFSLDYYLQEDDRFDEVGPAGQVLWYLQHLEPPDVLFAPRRLAYDPEKYDRSVLTPELLKLEADLDDEFSELPAPPPENDEVTITLTFPHYRVGTLPLSPRLAQLFPTAYEAPRIRFVLVDGQTGRKFPGWVAREHRYVCGLDEWYREKGMVAGGYLSVRRGEQAGEVVVRAHTRRSVSEWVRTASAASGGRLSFSMTRQPVGVAYDEHMILIVDDETAVDAAWLRSQERNVPLSTAVVGVFRELAKLNPQSAVHARALYNAVNVIRRCPPGPIFAELASRSYFVHVGDLYWRFDESRWNT